MANDFKVGEMIGISPDLTFKDDWVVGKIIEVEDNQFVGTVISAELDNGEIFFGRSDFFSGLKV